MRAAHAADVDDTPVLAVLDSEERGRLADQPERRRVVYGQHGVPLLVPHLVNHPVPGVSCIVDDDVDLPATKLGRLLDQHGEVVGVGYVAGHAYGRVGRGGVDR